MQANRLIGASREGTYKKKKRNLNFITFPSWCVADVNEEDNEGDFTLTHTRHRLSG